MRFTPTDITSTYAAITALNANFTEISNLLERCLFTDGTAPNQMTADIDMNGFNLRNVGSTQYNAFNQAGTGNFYAPTAVINRFLDRAFFGDATKNNGTNAAVQPDWLTTYELARGRSFGALQSTIVGVLSSPGQGTQAFLAGAQTLTAPADNYNAIGIWGVAVNNRGTSLSSAYGGYFEAHRQGAGSGAAFALEADIINFTGTFVTDPFTNTTPETIGLQLASGGEYPSGSLFSASAAIAVRNNHSDFLSGLVFGSDAIKMTAGIGEAIAFATGHKMQWYGAASTPTSSIFSDGTTTANGISIHLGEGLAEVLNASGKQLVKWVNVANAVNFLSVSNSITGSAVPISAAGSDANIDLLLNPKGTGSVSFGTWTGGTPTLNGYITIKDSAGNVRKLGTVA